jgi:predicted Zn-dependent protease
MRFKRKLFGVCLAFIFSSLILFPGGAIGITIKEEVDLSREFMKVVLRQFDLVRDPQIESYVNSIGNRILAVVPPQPFSYQFYVIRSDEYNAFATPAGHIFLNSGLIEAMEDENELAGIIAHEIAHVVCRHISQKIDRSKKIQLATLAGMAAGIFLGASGSATASSTMTAGAMAAGQSIELAYSRNDERQADQLGLDYLAKAGYDGTGLLTMLKKIRSRQWFGSNEIPTYLKTHPGSEERMGYIGTWVEKNNKSIKKADSYNFRLAHTRLVGLYGETNAALKYFEAELRSDPENSLAHYGYGLALARTGKRGDAILQLKAALEKKAFNPYILEDLGRIYFLDGRYLEALNVLEGAKGLLEYSPDGLFFLGRTQMELGKSESAVSTFEELLEKKPNYQQVYYFLGEAYDQLGRSEEAHYYLGIHFRNKGDLKTAAFHLKKASANITDSHKKSNIEKMLEEIRKAEQPKSRKNTKS